MLPVDGGVEVPVVSGERGGLADEPAGEGPGVGAVSRAVDFAGDRHGPQPVHRFPGEQERRRWPGVEAPGGAAIAAAMKAGLGGGEQGLSVGGADVDVADRLLARTCQLVLSALTISSPVTEL
jgi:hypothetical protein